MKFSVKDIENDETFQDFLNSRGITKNTRRKLTYQMKNYCNYQELTPTQLIEEADEEQDAGTKRKNRTIKKRLINYVNNLKDETKATSTIKSYLSDIKSFYNDNEIDIPKLPKNIYHNKDLALRNIAFDEIPTKEHVKKACSIASIRNKAMILMHFSSGMGSSEVRNLTYVDFLNSILDYIDIDDYNELNSVYIAKQILKVKDCIGTWKLGRYKKARPYVTFNSPESTHAIAEYLIYRFQNNRPVLSLDDYLFITYSYNKINPTSHTLMFERLNDACGFGYRKNGNRFFTSHRLRVAFGTAGKERGIDRIDIKRMMGQKGDLLDDAYLKTTAERLKNEYMKFVQDLSIEMIEVIEYGDKDVLKMAHKLEVLEKAYLKNKEIYELYDEPEVARAIIQARARKIMENK